MRSVWHTNEECLRMLKNVINYTRQPQPRQETRPFPSKAAGKPKPQTYSLRYVEDFGDPQNEVGGIFQHPKLNGN